MTERDVAPVLRVGMVGLGRRGAGNFLPALRSLSDQFALAWAHSRTAERREAFATTWETPVLADLAALDPEAVDLIAISVPVTENENVVRALLPHADRLSLVIDTPLVWSVRTAGRLAPLLSKFRRVVLAEDYMSFPQFEIMRRAVTANLVGDLKSVNLIGLGFQYHGLALLRSFVDFRAARSTSGAVMAQGATLAQYDFGRGVHGRMVGPYRRLDGCAIVDGTKGCVALFPGEPPAEFRRADVHLVEFERADGIIEAVRIGDDPALRLALPQVGGMMSMPFSDKSELNLMRTCGLMRVFQGLRQTNINSHYDHNQVFYDTVINRLAGQHKRVVDPFVPFGSNLVSMAVKVLR